MSEHNTITDPFDSFRLSHLPSYAKLFVAIFTTLMLCVCLWAMWIVYERKIAEEDQPAPIVNVTDSTSVDITKVPRDAQHEINEIANDSQAVLSPMWDSQTAGQEKKITNEDIKRMAKQAIAESDSVKAGSQDNNQFSENLGLAHVHVNGQTLLFFAMGFIFLFSSASPKIKKVIYITGGIGVLCHTIGLMGDEYGVGYTVLLGIGAIALLSTIGFMALRIYLDLQQNPAGK
jgi:hypothetical protein